jgi:integrase
VFTTTTGTPLDSSALAHEFGRLLASAGVPDRTPDGRPRKLRELRRTFATRLRDAGVPLEDVQRLGRWASAQVLLAHYAATPDERLRRSIEALELPDPDDRD